MTTNNRPKHSLPFVLFFSENISRNGQPAATRYREETQTSQIWDGQIWVDALDNDRPIAGTRITEVAQETTDDD